MKNYSYYEELLLCYHVENAQLCAKNSNAILYCLGLS